ncbi:probable RNA-binding protein EIF1AD [Bolinopsis microptera]|uniref:probable RNA-binding protein EIF1AD n=1 Tax=Bolinopsis microptera TaxID=2820187 RepID=UPI00307A2382
MSEATKRKIVTQEVVHGDVTLCKNQNIVKVLESKGNNLFLIEEETGHVTLCSMPPKFRKNVWIKRGDYLIVESIKEGKKVTCEMVNILYPPQIKDLKSDNVWPQHFHSETEDVNKDVNKDVKDSNKDFTEYRNSKPAISDSGSDSDDSLEGNVNQLSRPVVYLSSDSESEDD